MAGYRADRLPLRFEDLDAVAGPARDEAVNAWIADRVVLDLFKADARLAGTQRAFDVDLTRLVAEELRVLAVEGRAGFRQRRLRARRGRCREGLALGATRREDHPYSGSVSR